MKYALLTYLLALTATAQTYTISLRSEKFTLSQNDYFYAQIIDDRPASNNIGTIFADGKKQTAQLANGVVGTIENLIVQRKGNNQQAINIRVKNLKLQEDLTASRYADGKFKVTLVFERNGQYLSEYTYESKYTRSLGQIDMVESVLRKGLIDCLRFFDGWIHKNGGKIESLAKRIQLNIIDFKDDRPKDDTVYYERRLGFDDFRGRKPAITPYAGAIFTSIGYNMEAYVQQGTIVVNLQTKAYMVKGASWIDADSRTDYTLAHEQLHFDVTKLILERFKQRLKTMELSLEDYDSQIQYEYLETFREMNKLQEQYDKETNHGINKTAQAEWHRKIGEELAELR